ncbi:hypothetical protein [Nocardia sp. NPDC049149]|uniref:hypothetical protein n=1 Tax=Nocardia sp. NPDC049149 TaxID=3364315 RepID=UPI0037135324
MTGSMDAVRRDFYVVRQHDEPAWTCCATEEQTAERPKPLSRRAHWAADFEGDTQSIEAFESSYSDAYRAAEDREDWKMLEELKAAVDRAYIAAQDRVDERRMAGLKSLRERAELDTLARAYRTAEIYGLSTQSVTYAGWHVGARTGTGTPEGALMVYAESGDEAVFDFRPGQRAQVREIIRAGSRRDFSMRPYTIRRISPGLLGSLAPQAARLDVITRDGTVIPATVVARTFAVDLPLELPSQPRLTALRAAATASNDAELAAMIAVETEVYEQLRDFTVRVYDSADALLYEGPALPIENSRGAGCA